MTTTIEIIGGGSMGSALIQGLLLSDFAEPRAISLIVRPPIANSRSVSDSYPGICVDTQPAMDADVSVIAVRRNDVKAVCESLYELRKRTIVSVAVGVSLERLRSWLGDSHDVVRAVPNINVRTCRGQTALVFENEVVAQDRITGLFAALGEVAIVDEEKLHGFTALFGAGPGYLAAIAEAFVAAACEQGFDSEMSEQMVVSMFAGFAATQQVGSKRLDHFVHEVARRGGTTEVGLAVLRSGKIDALISEVVSAAAARSRESIAAPS